MIFKSFTVGFILCLLVQICSGQITEEIFPKTYWCPNDTLLLKFSNYAKIIPYTASRSRTESPGTDAVRNLYATIYYGKDSIRLTYHNKLPYGQNFYLNFESPKGKTTLKIRFNSLTSIFSKTYADKQLGQVQFDIPEVYELANVIWTLCPSGQKAEDLNKGSAYYKKVMNYFKPYLSHPIFKALDFPDSLYFDRYFNFRENSFAFNFSDAKSEDRLLFNGPYYYVFGNELADSSLFGKLKPLVEDFSRRSKFREFYSSNTGLYQKEIQRQKELLPIRQMWDWLEEQFPATKFQSYRIVFSPLIGGSHSTQNYTCVIGPDLFRESIMFVCGTDRYDKMKELSELQKEGLMSGVVFTEIDHNYVNRETRKYSAQVDSAFYKRDVWVKKVLSSDLYSSAQSVFNEYMTHSLFCLYVLEKYDRATADYIINHRESLMTDKRNFIKFKDFNRALIRISETHKELKAVALYPLILQWCKSEAGI